MLFINESKFFSISKQILPYIIGSILSLLLFFIILSILGHEPLDGIYALVFGAAGNVFNFIGTLSYTAMLLLCSLAFLVGLKGGFINIGIEGQLYIGAIMAYLASINLSFLPSILSLPLITLAAIFGGIIWIALPLLIKVKVGVNEIFLTMIMNFIATLILSWLVTGPLRDPYVAHPQSKIIPPTTWLPTLIPNTRLHLGILIAFIMCIAIYFLMYKTIIGLYIRAVGLNPRAAEAAGINVRKTIVTVGLLSGGLAGFCGMIEVNGNSHLLIPGFSLGWGYIGIAIAALGNFHPLGALIASFFYAVLLAGGRGLEMQLGLPIEIAIILQVMIVLTSLSIKVWFSERVRK